MHTKSHYLVLLLAVLASLFLTNRILPVLSEITDFKHGGPSPKDVSLKFWAADNQTSFMTANLFFRSTQWLFDGWGPLTRIGSDFYGDSYVWVGPSDAYYCMIVWNETHDFNLGQLDDGVYSFTYTSWGVAYKTINFEVGYPADINKDARVDIRDIAIVAMAFGSHNPDSPNWNPSADIYRDGKVDMKDVSNTAQHFGKLIP